MPKLKTHSGTKKRIKISGTGKLLHRKAYSGHFLSKKSAARKRPYGKEHSINRSEAKRVKRSLGV